MEFDSQLLYDIMVFLQYLRDVPLSAELETLRDSFIQRMEKALLASDNYMDMKPGKPPVLEPKIADNNVANYKPPFTQTASSFLYNYESKRQSDLQDSDALDSCTKAMVPAAGSSPPQTLPQPSEALGIGPVKQIEHVENREANDALLEIYESMSTQQAKVKAHKYGRLQRRVPKYYIFNTREFWAALVGSHLLSYHSERDLKPMEIIPIKNCICRPVAETLQRNNRKAESTFEIISEDKSYEFIASYPKEMDQWVIAICQQRNSNIQNVHQPQTKISAPPLHGAFSDNSNNEEYEEVITDLVGALGMTKYSHKSNGTIGNTQTTTKEQSTKSHCGSVSQELVTAKYDGDRIARDALPSKPAPLALTQRKFSELPPLPSTKADSPNNDEYLLYNTIAEPLTSQSSYNVHSSSHTDAIQSYKPTNEVDEDLTKIYDDIEEVQREVRLLEGVNKEREERTLVNVELKIYDDVTDMKKEIQVIKTVETVTELDEPKSKATKEPPKLPTRTSPIKTLFNKIMQRNESPQKENRKKKQAILQSSNKASAPLELPFSQDFTESLSAVPGHPANEEKLDISDYNCPPLPRPVFGNIPSTNDTVYPKPEEVYNDVANIEVGAESEADRRKRADVLLTKINIASDDEYVEPSRSLVPQNVVRNLNQNFNTDIYQNDPRDLIEEDEHYQSPRVDGTTHILGQYLENEPIYDDTMIVAQKKREIELSKQNPVVQVPSRTTRDPILPKFVENSIVSRINQFTINTTEKPALEKKSRHIFAGGKKPASHVGVIPFNANQLTANENEIYDDCCPMEVCSSYKH